MAATLPLSAQENAVFTDSPDLAYDATWGTSRAERYDVAVCLSFPRLEGAAVESVSFPWLAPEGASDVRICGGDGSCMCRRESDSNFC